MEVHKELGSGFLEAVYQEALALEFKYNDVPFLKEKLIDIQYKNIFLEKKYISDFICYDDIILELKAVSSLRPEHTSQVINYLKATNKKLGLLINFGAKSLEYKRIVN